MESLNPTRVVILGGGFAGVYTARYLARSLGGRTDVSVELLSEENYFVFQPLLPEVAAGGIAATHVVNPIRELVPGARFRCCRIVSVEPESRRVWVSQGEGLERVAVPYDHLVFGLGKVTSFSSIPGATEHAFAMKDLSDAFRLKNHVLRCLELADIEPDEAQKRALLTFVVAGGGFSGVETVGELAELVHRSLKYFPRVRPEQIAFKLIHAQDVVLPEMPEKLGRAAQTVLSARGVEVVLGERVRAASRDHLYLAGGRVIPTRTFVCTVGAAPNPIVTDTLARGGFREAELGGRRIGAFATDATLACVGRSGYWAVGDCAGVPDPSGAGLCPPTAQFAIRQAKRCAANILAAIDGRPRLPFSFAAIGVLASLGQRSAVASIFGVQLTGFLAWVAWRTVYLMKLPGLVRKLRVALDWTLDLFFPRDITQLQVFRHRHLHVHHFEPGETIVRQGQVGHEFYVVVNGHVDVVHGDGNTVARLGPREVFGERALLEDGPRIASVRASTAVDVLVMSRGDFRSMVASFPLLGDYLQELLERRRVAPVPALPRPVAPVREAAP